MDGVNVDTVNVIVDNFNVDFAIEKNPCNIFLTEDIPDCMSITFFIPTNQNMWKMYKIM